MEAVLKQQTRRRLEEAIIGALYRADRSAPRWGVDDCALWCAEPIREVLGYDPAAAFRGRYSTAIGARRVLGPDGLLAALQAAATWHGWTQIKPDAALPGDIALAILPQDKGRLAQTTFICRSPGWFVARSAEGFTALQPPSMSRAWSVL